MTELKILRRCFAYATFVFALLSFIVVPALVVAPFPHAAPAYHADVTGMILIFMRELILSLPPVLAVVCGMAWWTVKNGRASSRRWAMAASSLFLLYSLPFLVADIAIIEYSMAGSFVIVGVFISALFFSALGVSGLAHFSHSQPATSAAETLS
jgi:hypothetical protein